MQALAQLQASAADCATMPAWPLSDTELVDGLSAVHALEQQVAATKLHLIREIDGRGLPATYGATSCTAFLQHRLHIPRDTATRLTKTATLIDQRPALDTALTSGAISMAHVEAIGATLADLPRTTSVDKVDEAETALVGHAATFDPAGVRKLGARILWHIDPDAAERAEADAVKRQEERAHQTRAFTLSPTGDGRIRVTGRLDTEAAATINAALDPLCNPRRPSDPQPGAPRDERTATQRRADALVEVCRLALHTTTLPDNRRPPPDRGYHRPRRPAHRPRYRHIGHG